MSELSAGLFDLTLDIDFAKATEFGLYVHGQPIKYSVMEQTLSVGTLSAPLKLTDRHLRLRILLDRSSVEVFADEGEVTFSFMTLDALDRDVTLFAKGGEITVNSLQANRLESIWLGRSYNQSDLSK